jgi:hypothetical protein
MSKSVIFSLGFAKGSRGGGNGREGKGLMVRDGFFDIVFL